MTKFGRVLPAIAGIALISILAALLPVQLTFAAPIAELSPAAGGRGTSVTIYGTNLESFDGDRLSIFFDDAEIISSPVIVAGGVFETSFNVPDTTTPGLRLVSVRNNFGSPLVNSILLP